MLETMYNVPRELIDPRDPNMLETVYKLCLHQKKNKGIRNYIINLRLKEV